MIYRIKELNANAFMVQRSIDGTTWHDGVPVPAPTRAMADLYIVSMQEFDARDTEGVVVWHSEWPDRPKNRLEPGTVTRFEDFLD